MKFIVSRASQHGSDCRPVKGAVSNGDRWTIEINSLEELEEFIKINGRVIIGEGFSSPLPLRMVIYDDYIE